MNPKLSQQDLAVWIEREGSPWEFRHRSWSTWLKGIPSENPKWLIAHGYEIRLAPITTPVLEQEDSPLTEEEERLIQRGYDHLVSGVKQPEYRCRRCGERVNMVAMRCGCESGPSPWEPITTPLPAVKESLTPQPAQQAGAHDSDCHCGRCREDRADNPSAAPDVAQSATAKSNGLGERLRDAILEQTWAAYNCGRVWDAWSVGTMSESDFSPFSESENVEGLVTDIQEILETELTAALAQRDEARRLLGVAMRVMQSIYDDTECYADGAPDASAYDRLCNDISGKLRQPLSQITNHLNK